MKIKLSMFLAGVLFSVFGYAQPLQKRAPYDIGEGKVLYTIGYAHLDTEWNWDYPTTINEYIRNIMTENFHLFERYPDYVFNFTGSRRYEMMKEYYPELYEKVRSYIHQGRWYVSGSSVDEGEVNISSSESLIRQVLYGNNYFRKEFGVESADYILPDCFGFVANLPSVLHYCGLLGFSTQKLTWHSAAGIPFNVGVWNGPDGKGVVAALNATSYNGHVVSRLDRDSSWNARLNKDKEDYDISFDYRYYGVGDQGGAPREQDVKNAVGSLKQTDSKLQVVLTSSDQMYKDITPEIRKKLPRYTGDLLLTEHSSGSLTSQAYMKRMNRKNEVLARAAEPLAAVADRIGLVSYPFRKLNASWDLVLGSQFHDILPGTSIPKAYDYAWNDEFVAANGFASVLKNSVGELSSQMDTRVKGRALIVYNPVARNREDVVSASLTYDKMPQNVQVFNWRGKALPTQVVGRSGHTMKLLFLAKVPSVGLALFDVRETGKTVVSSPELSVTDRLLQNAYYKVTLNDNGDIESVYDKKERKELLALPARLEFLREAPNEWPSWNMDWNDRQKPPVGYMDDSVTIKVVESGPVRVAVEVTRKGHNSSISQVISLASGEAGKRVEVANVADWQSRGVSLKAAFPLTVSNPEATYNLGLGTITRGNNDHLKYEVPSKKWFDLTDKSGDYGVTILEDCKYGSDKPSDNTLRLTLLFTPEVNPRWNWCRYQETQDWGEQEFRYGIYGHKEGWQRGHSSWQGEYFNQPLLAFEVPKHAGIRGKDLSFLSVTTSQAGVMAFKKMEHGDYYLVRLNELYGKDLPKAQVMFGGKITDAYEVDGQERKIGPAAFSGNHLNFSLTHYAVRSYAIKLVPAAIKGLMHQIPVKLPYNLDVMSFDDNRDDGNFSGRTSIPAEMIPNDIKSDGIHFQMGCKDDGMDNAVRCEGQEINLPEGRFDRICILAAASEDTRGDFKVGKEVHSLSIQGWSGYIGQYYHRDFAGEDYTITAIDQPFVKRDNIAWFASHRHQAYPSKNLAYQYCYLYQYELNVPAGTRTIKLPDNNKIKVLAITVADGAKDVANPLQPLYDDFREAKAVTIR